MNNDNPDTTETNEKHSVRVDLMMTASQLHAIEEWRRRQPYLTTRAEAIRCLIQLGITANAPTLPTLPGGEIAAH